MLSKGKKKFVAFFAIVAVVANFTYLSAQVSTIYSTPYADFNLAMELFDKEKYVAAQKYFDKVIADFSGERSEVGINARYYSALCAMELFNDNSENLLIGFIRDYPENPKTKVAYFQLGKYWFRKRRYAKSIEWFDKVSIYDLGNDELAEYYFKLGYAYFMEGENNNALKAFYEIKDADTRFTATARYYYAHLSYLDKKYETALIDFKKIENHQKFSGIVPFYIAQIYYLQKKYDSLLTYAPPLLDSANTSRVPEISRLIAEAYFNTGKYKESIPYMQKYMENTVPTYEEYYEMGYANYKAENYKEAVAWFEKAINGEDSLSQLSYYHMADCYLALGNKQLARNSLGRAASMEFDDEVKEDALFNFAKLAYELSYHPYNDAIRAFEKYVNEYPVSKRISQAQEYLIGVYYTTKNYKEALNSLDRIEKRSYKLEKAYQRVAFYRGIELFNEHNYEDAITHFDLALTKNYDPDINLSSQYWKAESWYRIYKQDEAIEAFRIYLSNPAAITHENYANAYYGEGYALYRNKNYRDAITAFRNFVRVDKAKNLQRKNDALLRIGDCYFIIKQFEEAVEYYDKAILMGEFDTDYALFQSGVANGVTNNKAEKANLLLTLVEGYKESPYRDDAFFELGEAFISSDNNKSLGYYEQLINEYPNSSYQSKAHMKKGLIYFNQGNDDKALESFKTVIMEYRETPDANQAIDKVRQIYTAKGDLQGFQAFLNNSPDIDISLSSLDTTRYEIAENNYMNGNCEDAVKNFTIYLEHDSAGVFVPNARFYRAECEYQSNFMNEALLDYNYILQLPNNKFTETSLKRSAGINYKLEKWGEARANFEKLEVVAELASNRDESRLWLCRLNYKLNDFDKAIGYGEMVLKNEKLDVRIREEVQMIMAKSYQQNDNYNKAYDIFVEVGMNSTEAGAEAKYMAASIEYLRGNYAKCEEMIMQVVNQVPSFDYWIAKAFLLLSDKYLAEEDYFQAKYTLQSVIENYEGEDLKEVAQSKLEIIENQEKKRKEVELQEKKPKEIIINDVDEDYEYLFEEEIIDEPGTDE